MAGLDGLRALAVLAVIVYHLNPSWMPGGLLGVGIFFVLSGYLITDILVARWGQSGRLELKDFWLRRARRLLPALFFMLVMVVAWTTLFDRSWCLQFRQELLAAVLYASNWWLIFHQVSYFARFGPPSPLGHLWSLAVEEQFYLLWPLLLTVGLRLTRSKILLACLTLAMAAGSALAMALLYQPGTDPSRVYYGTDTRAFALLIGAALALLWPSAKLSRLVSTGVRFSLDLAGGTALLVMLLMIGWTNEYQVSLFQGGLVVMAVATAITVAVAAHPAAHLSKVLGCRPLRWLGVRSYGIYLWHYPVIVLSSPAVHTAGVDVLRAALQVAASIGLAALSWRFVEEPIRSGALARLWVQVRSKPPQTVPVQRNRRSAAGYVLLAISLPCVVVACVGMVEPTSTAAVTTPQVTSISLNQTGQTTITMSSTPQAVSTATSSDTSSKTSVSQSSSAGADLAGSTLAAESGGQGDPSASAANPAPASRSGQGVTAIGDSVMIDIAPYLSELLPGIVIDGQVGRQMYQAPAVVDQLKSTGKLGQIVIIELGTNGSFTKDQLISLLNALGTVQQIVLVNTRVPRPWQDVVNSTLAEVASQYPHTSLINWYAASSGKDSFFYPDGVHLDPEGSKYYASLVVKALD
ncbi:MAG: acetyltransferase [Bacilli bacterium]|nr:acetyltransferase [Bacilli bacterium]